MISTAAVEHRATDCWHEPRFVICPIFGTPARIPGSVGVMTFVQKVRESVHVECEQIA